jgi:hypothetical protein
MITKNQSDDWESLQEVLLAQASLCWSKGELLYLRDSFYNIEMMWQAALNEIADPKFIILGEAPLYGETGSYIYSKKAQPTSFLRPTDFPHFKPQENENNKSNLLSLMRDAGIIVIDLFPYALNEHSTPTLNYKIAQKTSFYSVLARKSFENFTKNKIQEVRSRGKNVSILVRYKRIMNCIHPFMEELNIKSCLTQGGYACIGSKNMGVDKDIFWTALRMNT